MKFSLLFLITCVPILFSSVTIDDNNNNNRFIFFLHNRFLELYDLNESHPAYGRAEYLEIIKVYKDQGFNVISEKRKGNVNVKDYALKVTEQIDSLLKTGIEPAKITVIGTSKGGYIAQYVSTFAKNPNLNFVFIGSFRNKDIKNIPEINYCGNILTIYEKTDPLGVSALQRKETSTCEIKHFKEIELNTGLKHGFLFKAMKEWIEPSVKWASGIYQ